MERSCFRDIPFMGVIHVNVEAMKLGFRMGDPSWSNLGQGQPEVGEIPGGPPRINSIEFEPEDHAYVSFQSLPELREAIAEFYNRSHRTNVSAGHVLVNTGSSPIFRNVFQLLSGPEYEIMIPRPYYSLYLYCATLAGATVKFYDIDIDTRRIDMDSFRRNFSP